MNDQTESVMPTENSGTAIASHGNSSPPASDLQGKLGTIKLALIVLGANGPVVVVTGFLTVVIGYGNGLGAPISILLLGMLLVIFTVGFTKMGSTLSNPGAFYAYITAGLRRPAGLGSSFIALAAYLCAAAAGTAFTGIAMNGVVSGIFGGPTLPWYIYGAIAWLLVSICTYFNVEFSARILALLMSAEIVMIAIYDVAVIAQGGAHGITASFLNMGSFTSGSVAIGLLFAATLITGFEGTALFREEAKNPEVTVRRATYMAVIGMAVTYAFTCWVIINALGTDKAVEITAADPTGAFLGSLQTYVGTIAVDAVLVLLVTSILAANLSVQNYSARYIFNLGFDGILPRPLGEAHPRHKSPHRAAVVAALVVLSIGAPVALAGVSALTAYTVLFAVTGFFLLCLYTLTSLSVFVYFRRTRVLDSNILQTTVAPLIAFIGLGSVVVLAAANMDLLIGNTGPLRVIIPMLPVLLLLGGCLLAVWLRTTHPQVYRHIGRQ